MRYESGGVATNTQQDFWQKVDVRGPDECWPWKEGRWHNGYGRFKLNYKSWRAHRYALTITKGNPPSGSTLALHRCHKRLCCNPKHLYWGDHTDNMVDRISRRLPAWNKGLVRNLFPGEIQKDIPVEK